MASNGRVQMRKLSLWDLFRLLQYETYQRRSLAPVRYAARTVRIKLFFRQVPKYFEGIFPLIDVDIKSRVSFS
jgi:hypothetical protein